ncbi:MAG: regulatory protein GemA [Burkholderiaceae bacterium]|jgi:hypothetical protein|nr:regulatory protein GemA [Burkholderiaceae bacterium]
MSAAAPRPAAGAADTAAALEHRRKQGIMAIKAAQRQLGLDDGAYRALLQAQTELRDGGGELLRPGKRSATELTVHEQGRVLDYMRSQGALHPDRSGGRRRGTPAVEKTALLRKLHALLAELERVTGKAHSLSYADGICRRNGWAERVDFCAPRDLHKLVGAVSRTLRSKAASRPPAT